MAQSMARTMDDLRAPAATWSSEIRNYEAQKRHVVDAGLVAGQQLKLPPGAFQAQERMFDPLLQRYRDNNVEAMQRHNEERERVSHLNRAADIQILREQPFHIVNHSSKLEKLAPGKDPMRLGGHGTLGEKERTTHGKGNFPDTAVDYNIVSNIPFTQHHWGREDERPRMKEKSPRQRKVPVFMNKDFHIITNKYNDNHSEKMRQEKRVSLLEGTDKHMQVNSFDPLVGRFIDPRVEERVRTIDDAREMETLMRAREKVPPSYKGRESAHYGILSHEKHNPDMLRVLDAQHEERKDRFKNRYIVEHNLHAQDIKGDHINEVRALNRVSHCRHEETLRRGYDIIDGKAYGPGLKEKHFHEPYTKTALTPWEKVEQSNARMRTQGALTPAASNAKARSMRPDDVKTMKLGTSSSAPSVRSHAASSQSHRSMRHSESASHAPRMPLAATPFAPPAPSVPGSDTGSVYSRPSRAHGY
eukprot:TRINITY_DN4781_c0_g2_i1.p1 TRINITY_DN4781_c0_g2~~TRINITY_DN4781_c0_g2_i1.p1  ORF type:complete len:495 (+),score=72.25 TRINITY_DN4781_c0_g2_i1:67-1485(+)